MSISLLKIDLQGQVAGFDNLPEQADQICNYCISIYQNSGFIKPWVAYLALCENTGKITGTCAFKTPPIDNKVEIAYFTFPDFENQGYGLQMAAALVSLAREEDPDIVLSAQTLPEENASTHILQKLGFTKHAEIQHPEDGLVWEWLLERQ